MKNTPFVFLILIFISALQVHGQKNAVVTPENALVSYLENGDNSFKWKVQEEFQAENLTLYRLIFTSQTWRDIEWNHELTILVPDNLLFNDALLFITGGSVKNGSPNTHAWDDDMIVTMGEVAKQNKAMTAIIWQVPNQPLYNDLTEDALISFTLHNYQNDKDLTWPLLFPMTKSAIRAMDAVQEFGKKKLEREIRHFVVSGASKRGWTTWLTGAHDSRVKAIGPMVIDVLNMPVNIDYHLKTWGDYSIQIQDYVNLGIAQQVNTPGGRDLVTMIDPYSYRQQLTMPKMLFIGTNDEYWPVDAVKHYIDSIPGKNYISYTPNAGHGLGDKRKAVSALSAFFGNTINGGEYPALDYSISEENESIITSIKTTAPLLEEAVLWSARSQDRDFRDEEWLETPLDKKNQKEFRVEINYPETGYLAFYIDLKYQAPFGDSFTKSTRMFVTSEQKLLLKE